MEFNRLAPVVSLLDFTSDQVQVTALLKKILEKMTLPVIPAEYLNDVAKRLVRRRPERT